VFQGVGGYHHSELRVKLRGVRQAVRCSEAAPATSLADGLSVEAAIRGGHRVDVGQSGLEAGVYYFKRTRHHDRDGVTSADDTRCESNTSRTSESAEPGNAARLHLWGQTSPAYHAVISDSAETQA